MADQEVISDGFLQTPVAIGSNDPPPPKKKRNLPGNPDPDAEVIALSPKTLMATNRFLCEICGKGFQRDQNLQLHRRGHNLPWKLKQRTSKEPRKRVYVCPEKTCVHHHSSRALGDLTGIKKHFCRKHGEKKWKCEKCNKRYAVQSDWKAHSKTCGTREYRCDCGTIFSRRDSFITHRAFCDALAEETARLNAANAHLNLNATAFASNSLNYHFVGSNLRPAAAMAQHFSSIFKPLPSSSSTKNETLHPQNPRGMLPLWLGTHLTQYEGYHETLPAPNNFSINDHNLHQLSSNINILNPHNDPLMISASNPRGNDSYSPNWVFGNKISTPLSNNNGEELEVVNTATSDNTTTSLPSLYSSQNPQTSSSNVSYIMSATALLQKATQIGVTSSNPPNDLSFLGSLGLMAGNNAIIEIGNVNYEDSNKYNGGSLFGAPNSTKTNLGSDVEGSSPDDLSTITMHQPAAKRQKLIVDQHDSTGGQTRDFLGVNSNSISCNPPSINGWI